MNSSIKIQITKPEDIFSLRSRIYNLIFQLSEDKQTSIKIASDFSETARALFKVLKNFNVNFNFDRLENYKEVNLCFSGQPQAPEMTHLMEIQRLQLKKSSNDSDFFYLNKNYRLPEPEVFTLIPSYAALEETLVIKSREQLFEEIDAQKLALQEILDNSPLCIGFIFEDKYKYVNALYQEKFGLKIGDGIGSLYPLQDDYFAIQDILKKEDAVYNKDVVLIDSSGRRRFTKVSSLAMLYNGENGYMEWITDISEQKEAEEATLKAKIAAEEANEQKSTFLANMSHEIRTPMNAIIGMSYLALQGELDSKQKNYIQKVNKAGENLLGIINDILDFSKAEAGKTILEKTGFNLEEVLENVASLISLKVESKGIELLFKVNNDVPNRLIGDALRLSQILTNLANNAVKFTESGEILIQVKKLSQTKDYVELEFSVKDSGIGISKEQLLNIFDSFSQADGSTTRKYGGTGLGLAISKRFVELMGGKLSVDSEIGKGSSFNFSIKLEIQSTVHDASVFNVYQLTGLRALVVDDNSSAREILEAMLNTLNIEVSFAHNGIEALEAVDSAANHNPFDIVIMDWQMPKMDGIEAARRLVDIPGSPPVIIVTSFGKEDVMDKADIQEINLDQILTKPVIKSALIQSIFVTLNKNLKNNFPQPQVISKFTITKDFNGCRILLVEDNEMNQELAYELLSQRGIQVTIANNGQESLDLLKSDLLFDCVLMDCLMPVMDGFTATREIRKLPQFSQLPIIAMTANVMPADRKKTLDAGMSDFIEKPLNVEKMFNTIGNWIKPLADNKSELKKPDHFNQLNTEIDFIDGINVKSGLANTNNDHELYRRILLKFSKSQSNFYNAFLASQKDSDPMASARCAHTLKGNAGNIGASALYSASQRLEDACTNNFSPAEIEVLLNEVVSALTSVLRGIDNFKDKNSQPEKKQEFSDTSINVRLKDLYRLLQDSDGDAEDLIVEILMSAEDTLLFPKLKTLSDEIGSFDFDKAIISLSKILKDIS